MGSYRIHCGKKIKQISTPLNILESNILMPTFIFLTFLIFFCFGNFLHASYVFVGLQCQLGNQMFEIATGLSLALDNNVELRVPDLIECTHVNIPKNYKHVFWRVPTEKPEPFNPVDYFEPQHQFAPIPYQPNMRLWGWWQSEKYFKHHKNEVLDLFAPSDEILKYLYTKYPHIINHPSSVALHVRTYAFENPPAGQFPFPGLNYFHNAAALFPQDTLIVVFSDNIPWCKSHFDIPGREILFIEDEEYYHDLYLISLCKHQIISNSTFSWWGAYLNLNPNKIVVAPKIWDIKAVTHEHKDVVPEEWIKLDSGTIPFIYSEERL
jgi:hypothetical protein